MVLSEFERELIRQIRQASNAEHVPQRERDICRTLCDAYELHGLVHAAEIVVAMGQWRQRAARDVA